jgi:hypothetical protein
MERVCFAAARVSQQLLSESRGKGQVRKVPLALKLKRRKMQSAARALKGKRSQPPSYFGGKKKRFAEIINENFGAAAALLAGYCVLGVKYAIGRLHLPRKSKIHAHTRRRNPRPPLEKSGRPNSRALTLDESAMTNRRGGEHSGTMT